MGINRDSRHKRRLTGGRMPIHKKKRAFEKARPVSNTKLITSTDKKDIRIRHVRTRGGNSKFRALRISEGTFSWASQGISRKTKVNDVVYNASNNELVRTKTLVKNSIISIDATPFRQWYLQHYGKDLGVKKNKKDEKAAEVTGSKHVKAKLAFRNKENVIDAKLENQFSQNRVLACISSRPGQSGRLDGYILEGRELEFYLRKLDQRRK